ncbi:hypothetical protein WHI96_27045 [Pseudonocardia tropica]|uniref:PQQ enzyme repeat protein n=1 Tax=Pseudonocardia tropica TaxID=681289 RepID=A0ABV1K2L8_9PSEU
MSLGGDTGLPAPQVLDGVYGWSLSDAGLTRVDLTSGEAIVGGFPQAPLFSGLDVSRPTAIGAPSVLGAPVLADLPEGRRVLAAWPVEQPGQGTTPARRGIELVAADPGTARTLSSITVPLPPEWLEESLTGFTVSVAGVVGTTAIVSASTSATAHTAAVDLAGGTLRWSAPGVAAVLVGESTVAVEARDLVERELRGLSIGDGSTRWAGLTGSAVWPVGRARMLVDLSSLSRPAGGSQVVEIATGRPVGSPLNGQPGWSCRSDDQALTICSLAPYVGTDAVLGFDAAGVELWRITRDSGRVPPTVTTAWHGMVYGYTDAGPLVLDGRTGQDRVASATTAPLLVNEYFAVGPDAPRTPEQRPNYRHPSRLVASPTAG